MGCGCAVLAGLACWAGLAMLARLSWPGWAGQVRLAGLATYNFTLFVFVSLVLFVKHVYVVLEQFSSFSLLCGSIFSPF